MRTSRVTSRRRCDGSPPATRTRRTSRAWPARTRAATRCCGTPSRARRKPTGRRSAKSAWRCSISIELPADRDLDAAKSPARNLRRDSDHALATLRAVARPPPASDGRVRARQLARRFRRSDRGDRPLGQRLFDCFSRFTMRGERPLRRCASMRLPTIRPGCSIAGEAVAISRRARSRPTSEGATRLPQTSASPRSRRRSGASSS